MDEPVLVRKPHELLANPRDVVLQPTLLGGRHINEISRESCFRVLSIQDVPYFGQQAINVLAAYQQAPEVVLVEAVAHMRANIQVSDLQREVRKQATPGLSNRSRSHLPVKAVKGELQRPNGEIISETAACGQRR